MYFIAEKPLLFIIPKHHLTKYLCHISVFIEADDGW